MEKPLCGRRSAEFPLPKSVGPRVWGAEDLLVHAKGIYTFKRIFMREGHAGGLQYHRIKDEAGYILDGELEISYDPGNGTLVPVRCYAGDVFHFPAGSVHKAKAITDCIILEVSNPVFNDRVHVEAYYGIDKEEGGLPSTKPWEIELL